MQLTFNATNCAYNQDSVFSELQFSHATLGFRNLKMRICTGGATNTATACNSPSAAHDGRYIKMSLKGYRRNGDTFIEDSSRGLDQFGCASISSVGISNTAKQVPAGNSAAGYPKFIYLELSIHTDSSCASAPIKTFHMREGFANILPGLTGNYSTGPDSYIFLNGD